MSAAVILSGGTIDSQALDASKLMLPPVKIHNGIPVCVNGESVERIVNEAMKRAQFSSPQNQSNTFNSYSLNGIIKSFIKCDREDLLISLFRNYPDSLPLVFRSGTVSGSPILFDLFSAGYYNIIEFLHMSPQANFLVTNKKNESIANHVFLSQDHGHQNIDYMTHKKYIENKNKLVQFIWVHYPELFLTPLGESPLVNAVLSSEYDYFSDLITNPLFNPDLTLPVNAQNETIAHVLFDVIISEENPEIRTHYYDKLKKIVMDSPQILNCKNTAGTSVKELIKSLFEQDLIEIDPDMIKRLSSQFESNESPISVEENDNKNLTTNQIINSSVTESIPMVCDDDYLIDKITEEEHTEEQMLLENEDPSSSPSIKRQSDFEIEDQPLPKKQKITKKEKIVIKERAPKSFFVNEFNLPTDLKRIINKKLFKLKDFTNQDLSSNYITTDYLNGAILRGANLSGKSFTNNSFSDIDFTEANFSGVNFHTATFMECIFNNVKLEKNKIIDSSFTLCSFQGSNFKTITINCTQFDFCNFQKSEIENLNIIKNIVFNGYIYDNTRSKTNFNICNFMKSKISNSELSTDFIECAFIASDLKNVKFNGHIINSDFSNIFAEDLTLKYLKDSNFSTSYLEKITLHSFSANDCKFDKASIKNLDIQNGAFKNSNFMGSTFTNTNHSSVKYFTNNFSNTLFTNTKFRDISFQKTKMHDIRFLENTELESVSVDNYPQVIPHLEKSGLKKELLKKITKQHDPFSFDNEPMSIEIENPYSFF